MGTFAFRVEASKDGEFGIQQEQVVVSKYGLNESYYTIKKGILIEASHDVQVSARIFPDRFFLTTVSALENFRPLYDLISKITAYNINPNLIRIPQSPDSGDLLLKDGSNISSVIRRLSNQKNPSFSRIQDYLRRVIPGVESVGYAPLGQQGTLEFRQIVKGSDAPWRFLAANMSDGTLRSLGVITALLQNHENDEKSPKVIAIEEPESTSHPGAAAVIMDAILEASNKKQVILTSHSPDLLDHPDLNNSDILNVVNDGGVTFVYEVDSAAKEALKEKLFTAGELLRKNQLISVGANTKPLQATQYELFKNIENA